MLIDGTWSPPKPTGGASLEDLRDVSRAFKSAIDAALNDMTDRGAPEKAIKAYAETEAQEATKRHLARHPGDTESEEEIRTYFLARLRLILDVQ